jgi:DNA-binding MarR family transcriptional regulator
MNLETDLIIHLITRIRRKSNVFIIAELEKHGLKEMVPVHGDVLYALFRFDELAMKEIANIVGRKKSSVTIRFLL